MVDWGMPTLEYCSLAERPDLVQAMWDLPGGWATFMLQDPVSETRYERMTQLYPELTLLALSGDELVARLHAVPIPWTGPDELPSRGWDWALETGVDSPPSDRSALSLIEARVAPRHRGRGLAISLLEAARERFRRLGTRDLVGPVRPTGKANQLRMPMAQYAALTRADGLPVDPWLRTHVRVGGRILHVAPLSMVIPGTLAQWREWTGLPFDTDGLVDVEGGVVPVHVDTAQDHAVYVEPNVWVHHVL